MLIFKERNRPLINLERAKFSFEYLFRMMLKTPLDVLKALNEKEENKIMFKGINFNKNSKSRETYFIDLTNFQFRRKRLFAIFPIFLQDSREIARISRESQILSSFTKRVPFIFPNFQIIHKMSSSIFRRILQDIES